MLKKWKWLGDRSADYVDLWSTWQWFKSQFRKYYWD